MIVLSRFGLKIFYKKFKDNFNKILTFTINKAYNAQFYKYDTKNLNKSNFNSLSSK